MDIKSVFMDTDVTYKVGDCFERIEHLGCGVGLVGLTLVRFKITNISTKFVTVEGRLVSGVLWKKKIQLKDFDAFLTKYKVWEF